MVLFQEKYFPESSGIRRHTTVPRMGTKEEDEESDDSKRERESAEEKSHNLPVTTLLFHKLSDFQLNQPLPYHRECRRLIRDLEKLKTENISLKNELALLVALIYSKTVRLQR